MIYKFLKSYRVEDLFFEHRFIYDTGKPEKVASLDDIRRSMDMPFPAEKGAEARPGEPKRKLRDLKAQVGKEKEKPGKEEKEGEEVREEVGKEKKKRPRRTVREGVQKTKKRLEEDLFGKDKLESYTKELKEAIERLGPDKLYEFIKAHNSYSGDYKKWNSDLCKTFGLKLNENEPEEQEHMRYAAALQLYLAEYFVKKGDVFQTLRGKIANPFIYIDGKLGGYTISALAAYWNEKYPEKKKEKGELKYADLEKEYGEQRKNKEIFDEAIAHLQKKLGQPSGPVAPGTPPAAPAPKPGAKPAGAPPVAPGGAPPAAPATGPDFVGPPEPPTVKPSEESKADKEKKEREWNEALQRAQRSEQLRKNADTLIDKTLREDKTHWAENIAKTYSTEFAKLSDKYSGDPDRVDRFSEFRRIPVFYGNDNIWPAEIFKKYKEAYDQVTKNPSAENIKRKDELYQMLSKSAADYSQLTKEIVAKLKGKYEPGLRVLIGSYELPHDVYIYNLEPIKLSAGAQGRSWKKEEPEQYKKQREAIERVELQNPDKIDEFYAKYFKEPPKRAFDNWDALAKMLKSPKDLEDYFIGVSPEGIVARVRQIILYRNMHRVYWESEWYKSEFNKELGIAIKALDSNFETYYKDYKGIKDKDFVADISSGQVKERPA